MSDTLRLERDIRAPGQARAWIVQRCHEWRCEDLADSAGLLVTELVTNVFLHARTDCLIHAAFDRPLLAVTVTDWDARNLVLHPASATAESGRGLAIIEALADEWGIDKADGAAHSDPAKSVWFHLRDGTADAGRQ